MKTSEFNLETYRKIQDEIKLRIDLHYRLMIYKVIFLGGMFSFLWSITDSIPFSPYFACAVFGFFFDVIILENMGTMRGSGMFVKDKLEKLDDNIIKWETDYAQKGNKWVCFNPVPFALGIWSVGPFFIVGSILTEDINWRSGDAILLIFSLFMLLYTAYLIHLNLGNGHYKIYDSNSS